MLNRQTLRVASTQLNAKQLLKEAFTVLEEPKNANKVDTSFSTGGTFSTQFENN